MSIVQLQTGPGVFEVLAHVSRSPEEALKQFVENAADAVELSKQSEGRIDIELKRLPRLGHRGKGPVSAIIIKDNGIGMGLDKLYQIAKSIGDSEKINAILRGEKGIGILAFSLLCNEVHISSTDTNGRPSACLVLRKDELKQGKAEILETCHLHRRDILGTIAHLLDVHVEVSGRFSKERLKQYLGREFAQDLQQNLYSLFIRDRGAPEPIEPKRFRGLKVIANTINTTSHGNLYIELYALPREDPEANISVYGRGGARICLLTDLPDLHSPPWTDKHLEGWIRFYALRRTADKTAVIQDEVYWDLIETLKPLESKIQEEITKITEEALQKEFTETLSIVRQMIQELAGVLHIPQFTEALAQTAEKDFTTTGHIPDPNDRLPGGHRRNTHTEGEPTTPRGVESSEGELKLKPRNVPQILTAPPPPDKQGIRSWYDEVEKVVYVNEEHPDFLQARRERLRLARYLTAIWIKEAMLLQYRENAIQTSDEMVGAFHHAEPLFNKFFASRK